MMSTRHFLAVFVLSCCFAAPQAGASGPAVPAAPAATASSTADDPRIDRLTDLVVEMVPFGKMFEIAAANPKWPVQDRPEAVTTEQLTCLRAELSPAGYRRIRRLEVADYVAADPARADRDIALLEQGAASMMGKAMMAGVESKRADKEIDVQALLANARPEQLMAFMTFMSDPKYAALRDLSGMSGIFGDSKSSKNGRDTGEAQGEMMAAQVMLKAMSTCDVPMSALFGK